jgi:hypothetical protein
MRWKILRNHLMPSPRTSILLWIALALGVMGNICAVSVGFAPDAPDPFGMGVFVLGGMFAPLVALLLVVGALRERGDGPKGLFLATSAATLALGGGLIGLGLARDPEVGITGAGATYACFCFPATMVLFVPAGRFLLRSWPEFRAALRAERERRAVEIIGARGGAALADLARELDLSEKQVRALLDGLLHAQRLEGMVVGERFESAGTLLRKRLRLAAIVHARGHVRVRDLAQELGVPLATLKQWIYELVHEGQFTGYINWSEGILYSSEAQKLRDAGHCPHCGGELGLAGKGVVKCQYCGAAIFL